MGESTLIVSLIGDSSSLRDAFKEGSTSADGFGSKMSAISHVAGIAGLALGGALVGGLVESVHVAMESQVSIAALNQAITDTGQSVKGTAPAIDASLSAGRNWGFENDDLRNSLARLEMSTKSTSESTKELTVAEDLARMKHISLAAATKVVTSANAGSARGMTQLGLAFVPVNAAAAALTAKYKALGEPIPPLLAAQAKLQDKQAAGAAIMKELTKDTAGQAAAYANTAQGGMAVFGAQMNNIEENLGTMLLPAIKSVTKWVDKLTTYFSDNPAAAKLMVGALGVLAVTLMAVGAANKIVSAATDIATVAQKAFAIATNETTVALLTNPFVLVVAGLVLLGIALYEAWEHSTTFRDVVKGAFHDVEGFVKDLEPYFKELATALKTDFALAKDAVTDFYNVAKSVFGEIKSALIDLKSAFQTMENGVASIFSTLESAATDLYSGVKSTLGNLASYIGAIPSTIEGYFSGAGKWLYDAGAAIIEGLIAGIKSEAESVVGTLESLVSKIHDIPVIGKLIGSPSPYFAEVGRAMMQGLGLGIDSGSGAVLGKMGAITGALTTAGTPHMAGAAAGGAHKAGGKGAVTITVPITVSGFVGNQAELATAVRQVLVQLGRREAGLFGGLA